MSSVLLTNDQYWGIRYRMAIGASAVAANYAESLIKRPYRTRGVYLKALAVVQYDRAYDELETSPEKTDLKSEYRHP